MVVGGWLKKREKREWLMEIGTTMTTSLKIGGVGKSVTKKEEEREKGIFAKEENFLFL